MTPSPSRPTPKRPTAFRPTSEGAIPPAGSRTTTRRGWTRWPATSPWRGRCSTAPCRARRPSAPSSAASASCTTARTSTAREPRRHPLRRALPRRRGLNGHDRDLISHQRVPGGSQQRGQRRERDRLRVSPGRRRDAGARAPPALPREPRQLGSRAGRRAGARPASRDLRQRRGGRLDRHDAEHDRADGARCHRVPRGPRARRGRPPRLLDRQLRRPGDRADQAGGWSVAWSSRRRPRAAPPGCTAGHPR